MALQETHWKFVVRTRPPFLDARGKALLADILDLGIRGVERAEAANVYFLWGKLRAEDLKRLGGELLADPITEEWEVTPIGCHPRGSEDRSPIESGMTSGARMTEEEMNPRRQFTVEVAYRPGVRDPVEDSLIKGAEDLGIRGLTSVHTAKRYAFSGSLSSEDLERICQKLLVNETIQEILTEQNLKGLLSAPRVQPQPERRGAWCGLLQPQPIETVHLLLASDTVLQRVSIDHQLSLNLEEMRSIQAHFKQVGREPSLIELETLAQTWSEHCKHKTFRGNIAYTEELQGKEKKDLIPGLLKSTLMKVTEELNLPWCVSVFSDNSGVVSFDEDSNVCFKVETHNHPSALEPFGGASTGLGGVIRDILGTGLGAKPIASTDVFCFAPPDLPASKVPPGSLHPRRVMKGVVAGVKDYGNKMGIPTVNGAVLFDERFVGNPLVYCGSVGLLPKGKEVKEISAGERIVLAGGLTGRDGIHGATFSSLALTTESEAVSSTAVQIGDPITEKKLLDALLIARDEGLFSSVTDCGAGGLSSAVGELGARVGAKVELDRVPLKYAGLTADEIWISESQERMVFAVYEEKVDRLLELFKTHGVKATAIGEFTGTEKLELLFNGEKVGELSMEFLHEGVPQLLGSARWSPPKLEEPVLPASPDLTPKLLALLGRWDTCSKEWIIRQYDHEVQGGSALKPLLGAGHLGPSDAAVVRPKLSSFQGVALANGINFRYGDLDPYWMAALAVEEAIRQLVAVGARFDRIALLDNFCWGDPTRPEVLGSLVRAALGARDAARAFGTPFISGKDSLHNEYRAGEKTIQIPGTLLISSLGILPDARRALSMDAKRPGNFLYGVGLTRRELGGSAYYAGEGFLGAEVPRVDFSKGPELLRALSEAIAEGLAVSAHDCSEGGLGVSAAEMAFAGGLGLTVELKEVPVEKELVREDLILFSESPTRLLLEIPPEKEESFRRKMSRFPMGRIGAFQKGEAFRVLGLKGQPVVETTAPALASAWRKPFQGW
ncbi:MAG: phosphoribosylformylglycinamidine synthase subunit PurL [Candidatus Omnitrophica bacterium]|nr:phosphoribosylformylglycinamidine synthase subunit PurL [Candidatus Omnitrophota bacterium]